MKLIRPMIKKVDEVLSLLDDMGLDHIRVHFEAGLFRGKPRNLPVRFELVFPLTGNDHTGTHVVVISQQGFRYESNAA